MEKTVNYEGLPESLKGGMQRYIEHGIEPGSFLGAVLRNDLMGSFAHADMQNRYLLFDIANWLYNEAPSLCWGDKAKVKSWLEKGGMDG